MRTFDCYKKKSDVVFSVQVGNSKLALSVQPVILVVTFAVQLDEKFKWAKSMLKAEVKIRYSLVDNKVITLQQGAYLTTSKLFNSWHSHSQPYVKLDLKDNFPTT